jgi:hypothetical protein
MTDLNRLRVSLTKHNAHKVASLLREYPASEVFRRLEEVHAEAAQARKNLSVLPGDTLPPVWNKVQAVGPDAIDALVLVAIVFSHHDLITAMSKASGRSGLVGRIERDRQLSGKAYTNFVRIIDQLSYATRLEYKGVTFNLTEMFEIGGLGPLVGELLELKLLEANWDRSNSVAEEATRLGFHEVFGISAEEFVGWLSLGSQPEVAETKLPPKDREFFGDPTEGSPPHEFEFKPGHVERDVDPLPRAASVRSSANRLHNDIQNRLYAFLKAELGAQSVGTELDTGSGTAVDVVTKHDGKTTFYEIKTASSVRASIRQALPQLLEYAFWPEDRRADELVVVSHLAATHDGNRYIKHLRREFGLPLSYKQFDLDSNSLKSA